MKPSSGNNHLKLIKKGSPGSNVARGGKVRQEKVINALNRINFQDGDVFINLRHRGHGAVLLRQARPLPCKDKTVEFVWDDQKEKPLADLSSYEYQDFFYTDGLRKTLIDAPLKSIGHLGLTLELPEFGYEVSTRRVRRVNCRDITVRISQSDLNLTGALKDFNAVGFAVIPDRDSLSELERLNLEKPVSIVLKRDGLVVFSETCLLIRYDPDDERQVMVFAPQMSHLQRFKPKEYRSIRQALIPQPNIVFDHPLVPKRISLRALDISGSGLAVEEEADNNMLMPGMIIQDASINFANNFQLQCKAQVLFNLPKEADHSVKCGLVFLDMNVKSQVQLSSILSQAKNEFSYVGTCVDLDALWEFFFETGFIYPQKYLSIQEHREKFKELYSCLYNNNPDIARHIIYQDKGVIYGHVSMFRFYSKTWLLHHHAAIRSSQHKAGLVVMDHILQHINEVHNISSTNMKYIACYFQPKNRFADRAFGGAARHLDDPRKCSLDDFAYFHFHPVKEVVKLPSEWNLAESTLNDMMVLKSFYKAVSGGLMLEGLDLTWPAMSGESSVNRDYEKIGFKRERRFFSLRNKGGVVLAIFVVNISDVGLNMSDLTNCVQAIVIEDNQMRPGYVETILEHLRCFYGNNEVPVLLFPCSYADEKSISYDKVYKLTVLDLSNISPYLEFMGRLIRPAKKKSDKLSKTV